MSYLRIIAPFASALALALAALGPAGAAGTGGFNPNTDGSAGTSGVDANYALVLLAGDPLTTAAQTRPAPGKKVDFDSTSVKSYRALLSAQRNDFKQWLQANAPKANVTGQYDTALNAVSVQLNGVSLDTLRTAPQVVQAQYEVQYAPDAADPDLAIIDAVSAWNRAGGAARAGEGVKVAVVDTGIDVTHSCFSDAGYPARAQLGDTRFTNNKVIAARVFNNKTPSRGYTAEAIQEHGTHVAGTIGCDYLTPVTVGSVDVPYDMSGVAPRALLGNYNVFPGDVTNARSEDIMNALEVAYQDGFDVANMSLGGSASGIRDLLTIAVDNLDAGNMVVAVAAGNSGPGHYTVESPGSAARALTAGASTVPHFVGAPVTVGGTVYGAASGDFSTATADLTAPLGVVTGAVNGLGTACAALPAGSLTGKIALISRGGCTFSTKIRNAEAAGAVATLVANNVAGDPVAMASDGTPNQPAKPAYMVALSTGTALAHSNGVSATIGKDEQYISTPNVDIMAGFSSQGPTDVDFRVKPDVVAPGVNVLSSIPHQFCATAPCFAFFQGTSMATPHLAGSAAVVRGQHPDWSAAEVRSAIVNTADQGKLKSFANGTSTVTDPNIVGAGRENLLSAVNASVALDPVSVSFGAIPSGSGQTQSLTVTVSDLTGNGGSYPVAVSASTGKGVSYSVSATSISVPAGGSATFTVTMSASKSAVAGDHYATLTVGGSHAAVYTFIK